LESTANGKAVNVVRGRGDDITDNVNICSPTEERAKDILMQSVNKMIGSMSGHSFGIVFSSGEEIAEMICKAAIRSAYANHGVGTIEAEYINVAGGRSAYAYNRRADDITELIGTASPVLQEVDDALLYLCAEMIGQAPTAPQEVETILLDMLVQMISDARAYVEEVSPHRIHDITVNINVANATVEEIRSILFSDKTESIGTASGTLQEHNSVLMDNFSELIGTANSYTLEVPSQRGNILRIPTVYSATQNGKVLVVI
jgi:hypothetical protein